MLGRLFPKEYDFFGLFTAAADLIVEAARTLEQLFKDDASGEAVARQIKDLEHRADEITHQTMTLLHSTFITPIDRQDIHDLIKRLDDIMDFIDAAASRIVMYEIGKAPPELVRLARINTDCAQLVKQAVSGLSNLKNPEELHRLCVEINRLENEADQLLRSAVAKLFREESDIKLLIKLKEVFELMESVSDRCEDVANVVESIVLEYA
jgi:hypothetical protein